LEKNRHTLPNSKRLYDYGFYVVTWDSEGNFISYKYYGLNRRKVKLDENQTLELRLNRKGAREIGI